ncbi:two-component system response regulator [Sulfuriferula sp. AH1]|uniref:HD domain-containing phosphohydrolase n=1 Tax=Sulfuriferula sp. AH1 TaxID=1985873 RepID=UPI000B3B1AE6|nr:HD domain-containing phosphohydrolase [Sulfuriferula sp. AH1]ARU32199.1 two-component system response regulator [Sulfuriferula sp. AH1]
MNDMQSAVVSIQASDASATLLFVDDESNILASLKRLFRPFGYRILTAESGAQGLEILAREAVDLVISDMRMPEMNGAQFLEKVREGWPETVRILLTGYAEIGATIDAINKGQIYRYIAKPWEDSEIVLAVRQALELKALAQEKRRLEDLTLAQNEELKNLNVTLEERVKARTEEVRQTMGFLEVAHDKLKKSFITSIRVFSNLIEMREGPMAGHSRRVADLARTLAQRMGMNDAEVQDVFLAALLHDVGKIGLPDSLLAKPFSGLTSDERTEVVKHPAKGEAALMALEQLQGAAKYIRGHHERFDGLGYPDKLAGLDIPLGARILALANDYDAVQLGTIMNKRLTQKEALVYIQEGRGNRYDPAVVDAFLGKMAKQSPELTETKADLMLNSMQLQVGMVLSRDMVGQGGNLLLSKDYVLNAQLIEQIRNFERLEGQSISIWVCAKKGD